MKKIFLFLLFISSLFLSSCIEITEEIIVNSDQSGKLNFKINLKKIGFLINTSKNYFDISLPDEINKQFASSAKILKNKEGISNVNYFKDKKNELFSLSFDFENTKELNNALYELFNNNKHFYKPSYIKINKKKLKKANFGPALRMYIRKQKNQNIDKELFELVTYKTIYHFPDKVKKASNKKAIIKNDETTVVFKCRLDEIINNKLNVGNRIYY
ncbi:MAG: hypothetical protein K8R58_09490 [Bacteroidales bacterium]|nr:hypothetical protein [Bacteroidales bacterium]